jgi:hypothetical protein
MDSWRVKALQRMVKTYRPTVEVDFILDQLSYPPTKASQGIEFIARVGGVISTTPEGVRILDPKSVISGATVVTQDDQLLL